MPVATAYIRPTKIEDGEADQIAPGNGVADASIKRIGFVFGEPEDVWLRLDAGKLSEQTGDSRS